MKLNYTKSGITHEPITYWATDSKTNVAIYQGFRGENPELDFIVKYREDGKRLRTPSHTHWIVDLLVKCEFNKNLVLEYVKDLILIYENTQPFISVEERNKYKLIHSFELTNKYDELNKTGYYSVGTLTSFIELFSICEKQTTGAFMFQDLLKLVKEYCEGKKDFYQVVGYSKRV
jgi:hypothetical protein